MDTLRPVPLREFEAFMAVAEAGSFVEGARAFKVSASAMSQIIKRLEERVGTQLFRRTTRSISLTEEGQRFLVRLRRAFQEIDAATKELDEHRAKPAGTVRVVAPRVAYCDLIEPLLPDFHRMYPEVSLDIRVDEGLTDIVSGGYDIGFRLGEYLSPDTTAFPVGPSLRQVTFASPEYVAAHGVPTHPRDLTRHGCINWRPNPAKEPYVWEFERGDEKIKVAVTGALTVSDRELAALAARKGLGIALWVDHRIRDWIKLGEIVPLLEDWCPRYPGFYAYYYRDRHLSAATRALISALQSGVARDR